VKAVAMGLALELSWAVFGKEVGDSDARRGKGRRGGDRSVLSMGPVAMRKRGGEE